jgi:16S rRNA (cytosine967-C5)-methyltransferase
MTGSTEPRGVTPARRVAFEVLRRTFEHGSWADRVFRTAAERHGASGAERARAQRLAYGAVQRRATSDHIAELLARRATDEMDPPVRAALRLGLYELLFTRDPAEHAAVGEAVELAKRGMRAAGAGGRARPAAGLVNAVLRAGATRGQRLVGELDDSTPEGAAIALSYPAWLAEMWWGELGPQTTRAVMAAMNEPLPRALRVNTLRADQPASAAESGAAGRAARGHRQSPPFALPETLVPEGRWGEGIRARIEAGELVPQSRASQAVVALLDPQADERVLDLCAGPGVKSTHMAARMEGRGEIRSVEINQARAEEIATLARKLGAGNVRPVRADAAEADLGAGYDRVLVDPPCTDLGTLASRPDARWRKTAADPERLASIQTSILARGATALRRGGTLVYSTCTISKRENEDVVLGVLEMNPDLIADDLGAEHPALASSDDSRFLQTRPDRDQTDGFFIARLRRSEV